MVMTEYRPWKGSTASRLVYTFVVILALFALALVVVLQAMTRMEAAEQEDARLDVSKHDGHRVAALVREQYIHQAHTIIEWNRSHLGHYQDVARLTGAAADELVRVATRPDDHLLAEEIRRLVKQNDTDFMTVTLPAIDRDEHANVLTLHADMEKVVVGAARATRTLNASFEAQSDAARKRATKERSRVRWIAITCFGAALVLATVFAFRTTRFLGRRVQLLRQGARRFGDGELEERIRVDGADELAEVARALNEMASRLSAHQAELLRSQKLASIGRLSAGVAHEINGPIGIILGYAKVIRTQGADEEAISAIEDEARQCERIVQALLDTSRPEAPRSDAVDLGQLARDAVERLRAAGRLRDRSVVVRAEESVVAFGDESRLRQVVLNLLTNAVEATKPAGRIEVDVARAGGRVVLSVSDDGEGMTASARERVFEPFFTTKERGTGLGLAISRAIVEAHRGELRLDVPSGRGTRVELRLEVPEQAESIA